MINESNDETILRNMTVILSVDQDILYKCTKRT